MAWRTTSSYTSSIWGCRASSDCVAPYSGGRPRAPVTFFLLVQEESNQRRRTPHPIRRTSQARAVPCACSTSPAGITAPGRLDLEKQLAHCLDSYGDIGREFS